MDTAAVKPSLATIGGVFTSNDSESKRNSASALPFKTWGWNQRLNETEDALPPRYLLYPLKNLSGELHLLEWCGLRYGEQLGEEQLARVR